VPSTLLTYMPLFLPPHPGIQGYLAAIHRPSAVGGAAAPAPAAAAVAAPGHIASSLPLYPVQAAHHAAAAAGSPSRQMTAMLEGGWYEQQERTDRVLEAGNSVAAAAAAAAAAAGNVGAAGVDGATHAAGLLASRFLAPAADRRSGVQLCPPMIVAAAGNGTVATCGAGIAGRSGVQGAGAYVGAVGA